MACLNAAARTAWKLTRRVMGSVDDGMSNSKPKVSPCLPQRSRITHDWRAALSYSSDEKSLHDIQRTAPVQTPFQTSGQLSFATASVQPASRAQQDQVKPIFGSLLAVIHNMAEAMTAISEFELQVQEAANAGLFRVWPFRASSASAHWYLPDLIHFASKMQRLDAIFPYLEVLFSIGSAATLQPNHHWCLYESLCLLAEAHDLPITSKQTKLGISRLLGQWSIMRLPVNNVIGVWSTQPQPCRIEDDKREVVLWVVGALQANRTPCCDCSPSAAMQLVSVRSSEKPANPQGLYTAEAVQAIVEQAVLEAKANDEKTLKVLLQRPNGRSAIRGYVRRHTVKYAGNFNKQMIARKREKEQAQRSLQDCSITSPMLFTTLLESADDLGEDPYI